MPANHDNPSCSFVQPFFGNNIEQSAPLEMRNQNLPANYLEGTLPIHLSTICSYGLYALTRLVSYLDWGL